MKTFLEFINTEEATIEEEISFVVAEELSQQALISLYGSLNEENKNKFVERLRTDTEKMIEFALSKYEE